MHILLLQVTLALAFKLARWCAYNYLEPQAKLYDLSFVEPNATERSVYIICLSVALPCGYQAMHHFSNLQILVMIMSIDYRSLEYRSLGLLMDPLRRALLVIGVTMIYVFDLRLNVVGITLSIIAAASTVKARYILRKRRTPLPLRADIDTSRFRGITLQTSGLVAVALSALFWCHFRERQFGQIWTFETSAENMAILFVNMASSSIALDSTGHLFVRPVEDLVLEASELQEHSNAEVIWSLTLVGTVSIGNLCNSKALALVSPWQCVGYGVSLLATLSASSFASVPRSSDRLNLDLACRIWRNEDNGGDSSAVPFLDDTNTNFHRLRVKRKQSCAACSRLVLPLSLLLMLLHVLAIRDVQLSSPHTILGRMGHSSSALDIVIARYDESSAEVAKHISQLLSLRKIHQLQPTIHIYNKGRDEISDHEVHEAMKPHLKPAIAIHTLPNVGRETDTYLEHITQRWENLANHTLFMQAGMHFGSWAYSRHISDYFVPSTGFLSLAPSESFCSSCDGCHDRDWAEDPELLSSIFEDFNNATICADITLTYRGQFVASAARIRGNRRDAYQRWLQELRDTEGKLHRLPYTDSIYSVKKDSMAAPRVGFTLERTWGVMMQCSGRRIASRCPSFLSGFLCPPAICGKAALEDCQCLDR